MFKVARTLSVPALAIAMMLHAGIALAGEKVNAYDEVAMDGFDVVAYFQKSAPTKGAMQFRVEHKGKSWLFASQENADAFAANPAAYEPQFNGWCAYAISEGYGAEVDFVNGWAILDNKLYLNWDAEVRDIFIDQQTERKAQADANWSEVHRGLLDGSVDLYTHESEGVDIAHPQQP
ncbi:MAG: YHS domain-containing (seleno)protein [Pseudomonadota bacterium]